MAFTKKMVRKEELGLYTEAFGSRKSPALILIMGASGSSKLWDDSFCQILAEKDFHVIRYDNRDTGQSTTGEPGKIWYSIDDMANDCLAIADAYELKTFHLVGLSLGGMIAQIVAVKVPQRVRSLALLSTSPWADIPDLPGIEKSVMEELGKAANLDWTNRDAYIKYFTSNLRVQAGGARYPFDEEAAKATSAREFDHAKNIQSSVNHARLSGAESYYGKISQAKVPTVIIHGSKDPVLPLPHAQAAQAMIPNSKLVVLDKGGHEIAPGDFEEIAELIHANSLR